MQSDKVILTSQLAHLRWELSVGRHSTCKIWHFCLHFTFKVLINSHTQVQRECKQRRFIPVIKVSFALSLSLYPSLLSFFLNPSFSQFFIFIPFASTTCFSLFLLHLSAQIWTTVTPMRNWSSAFWRDYLRSVVESDISVVSHWPECQTTLFFSKGNIL